MRIINMKKRAIIILLIIGIAAIVSGCVRYPGEHNGNGETNYQLEITVEVAGNINSGLDDDGIYYIVLDADGNPDTWPGEDILPWEDSYYYIKLEGGSFYFAKPKEDFGNYDGEISDDSKSFQVTIALSDLDVPIDIDFSIDINVITADSEDNTYDYLDNYLTISTDFGSSENIIDTEVDSGDGGPDFDIKEVKAAITTL